MYKVSDFDYHLPPKLIAQKPIYPRDHSRLLVLNKVSGQMVDKHFFNLPDYLQPGDVLVLNNSKVFPARLWGHKQGSGGRMEIFLLRRYEFKNREVWQCLLRGKSRPQTILSLGDGLEAKILQDNQDNTWQVQFNVLSDKFMKLVFRLGQVPLPPYIKRGTNDQDDSKSYQTVYAQANKLGSVAAPTAGLHFTKKLLKQIEAKGVIVVPVTLHVGLGTFLGVKTADIRKHQMHTEYWEMGKLAARRIVAAKKAGHRVVAVGTTASRVLETWGREMRAEGGSGWTDIFIYPGYDFRVVDALVTNFHLPQSTLLMLVSALAGKKNIDLAYQHAKQSGYRFFSYGDAMFIA